MENDNKPTLDQIEKVAEWWAIKTFDVLLNQDNGDRSETGGIGFMLSNLNAMKSKEKMPADARDRFKKALIDVLSADPGAYLDVDYHPSQDLVKCCQAAGVDTIIMPIKTFTVYRRSENKFEGKFQYGGKWETIS